MTLCPRKPAGGRQSAFTLIEIMLVIGIFALMIGMGAPSFYQAVKKEPMRKALTGMTEACQAARAQAILQGKTVSLDILPQDRTFSVEGGGASGVRPGAGTSGEIADSIGIEMLDVNLTEYREADLARVRFFPNGTCDEFTLILRSSRNDWVKLALDPTTGGVSVGSVQ
jgi:prepilin-type N-terminal cleavage/methylation domain-containing protein